MGEAGGVGLESWDGSLGLGAMGGFGFAPFSLKWAGFGLVAGGGTLGFAPSKGGVALVGVALVGVVESTLSSLEGGGGKKGAGSCVGFFGELVVSGVPPTEESVTSAGFIGSGGSSETG